MEWALEHINAIVQAGLILSGVVSFFLLIQTKLTSLQSDVVQVKDQMKLLAESMKQLNTILTQIAVQDARINMIEKDIDELRHRKGFID